MPDNALILPIRKLLDTVIDARVINYLVISFKPRDSTSSSRDSQTLISLIEALYVVYIS